MNEFARAKVVADIQKLIPAQATRAVALCEAFLAGCHAKAEQLDDSSGNFGMFVKDLICLWIKARQADAADPDKTAGTLLAWMDGWMDDDPYAFCYEIEKDTSAAFDHAGRPAFEKQVRTRFEAVSEDPSSWQYRRNPRRPVRHPTLPMARAIHAPALLNSGKRP